MDKKNNKAVDVSTFFIFEATGDSEADDCDDPNKATAAATIDRDNDDAESSCSHDDDLYADNFPFVNNKDEVNGSHYDNVRVCVDDKEEEGEEAHSAWPQEQHNNNNNNGHKNSVDSDHEELMSEKEKNKLFWESCLAS